jgi:hypothetical protein
MCVSAFTGPFVRVEGEVSQLSNKIVFGAFGTLSDRWILKIYGIMCVCAFTGSFESGSGLDLSLKPRCI